MPAYELAPNFIAWWGAGLSSLLAIIKLWEIWRSRLRLEVAYNFTGDPRLGNKIMIRNLSAQTFILTHWELLYCKGYPPFREFQVIETADLDASDQKIEPYSTFTLDFADANYFDWGEKKLQGRRIFMRVFLAGRTPTYREVYAQ